VIGTNLGGVKIGGDIDDAFVVFPDPMGATGSTIKTAVDLYKSEVKGKARKFIAIHLIVTPEYIQAINQHCPDLNVYAIRLDRGLSSPDVLASIPGSHQGERGLNDKQYILPGAGGLGEVINNSYV
jgi:uracil phosphoribosyltransferase